MSDGDAQLLGFGARDYDPFVGRWTSKDPLLFRGHQTNLYVYAGNDPVNEVDPSGAAVSSDDSKIPVPPTAEPAMACTPKTQCWQYGRACGTVCRKRHLDDMDGTDHCLDCCEANYNACEAREPYNFSRCG